MQRARSAWAEIPSSPEQLRFDTAISGRSLRAILSGVAYYRSFTP